MTLQRSDAKVQALLDQAAKHTMDAIENAARASKEATTTAGEKYADDAVDSGMQAANLMRRAGVNVVLGKRVGGPAPERLVLGELSQMSTPESRDLLAALRGLLPLAEAVDAQRGKCLAPDAVLLPGESYGTDVAETISTLILKLKNEVEGPKGRE